MKHHRTLKRLFPLVLCSLSLGLPVQAAVPPLVGPGANHPERQWQVFETPHFQVHYYQGFETFARTAAEIAEAGFERIAGDLGVTLRERIPLIITEDEFWNGYAEPLRNRIVLDPRFALEPTIGLPRFMLHEMTHILNFEAVRNPMPFGKLVKSAGLPAWFAEGLAQYEAEFWAPEMDRLLRLHVLNRSVMTPAERNAFILLGKRGGDGYNEGYALVRYLFDTYGHGKLPQLLRTYREQNLSFDQALGVTFGKPLIQLEAEWRDTLEKRYRAQIQHRQASLPGAKELVPYKAGRTWYLPQVSPDGQWLAYLATGGYPTIRGHLYPILPLRVAPLEQLERYGEQQAAKASPSPQPSGAPEGSPAPAPTPVPETEPTPSAPPDLDEPGTEPVPPTFPAAAAPAGEELKLDQFESKLADRPLDFRWRPDSQAIAYASLVPNPNGNATSRVLIQKLKRDQQKLVNDGDPQELDAETSTHSPAWSPDGQTLAVVAELAGSDRIVLYDVQQRQPLRTLLTAPDQRQYRNLSFSPDGQRLVAEVFYPGEGQQLMLLDLGSGELRQLTAPPARTADRAPIWSPDGKSLNFVSTRNGFADLYRLELDSGRIEQLSQVYTGLETPSWSPDGRLYLVRHHAEGTSLERVEAGEFKLFGTATPDVVSQRLVMPERLGPELQLGFEPHSYLPWLTPEVVVPVVSRDEQGDQLGFLAQFSDLLQQQGVNVLFLYGLASARIGYSASYINRMFDTSFGLEISDTPVLSFTTDGSQFFIQRDQHLSLFANRPLFNAGTGDTGATEVERLASLEFMVSRQTNLTTQLNGLIAPQQLREGWNNTLSLTFSDDRSSRKQSGFRYSANLTGGSWLWGSQYNFVAGSLDWRQYVPTWGSQTLAYFVTGTAMTGETRPALLGGPPLSNLLILNFQNIVPLRGFRLAELQGPMMLAGSIEYRFPLVETVLLNLGDHYLENLTAAAYVDAGDAWYPDKRLPYPTWDRH